MTDLVSQRYCWMSGATEERAKDGDGEVVLTKFGSVGVEIGMGKQGVAAREGEVDGHEWLPI